MKVSALHACTTLTLLAATLVGCGETTNLKDVANRGTADDAASAPAPAGEMSLTVPEGTLRNPSEKISVVVEDAAGKKHERTLSKVGSSTLSFSGLNPGLAKVSARLEGAPQGDLKGAGQVEIVLGKLAHLELALTPVTDGGLDVIIQRPKEIKPVIRPTGLKKDGVDSLIQNRDGVRTELKSVLRLDCKTSLDCVAIPYGARACGGPEGFFVASRVASNMVRAGELRDKDIHLSTEINKLTNAVSICSYASQPAVQCNTTTFMCAIK